MKKTVSVLMGPTLCAANESENVPVAANRQVQPPPQQLLLEQKVLQKQVRRLRLRTKK